MARDVESLVLQMSADLRRFDKSMAAMKTTADRRLSEVERRAIDADQNLSRIMGQTGQNMVGSLKDALADLAPTVAAAFTAQQVVKYADAWTSVRNALTSAGVASDVLASRQGELVDLANDTRSSTEQTVDLYRRLTIATQEMGMSQGTALRLTELLNKSFQSSGASTAEAASAALQLSQALASGTLQGDELRSIRENAPQLAQAIARAMGVSIGELKKLGSEGKITAQVVAQAILASGDAIDAKFAATTATVSQALQVLDNQLGRYIGQSDASLSATQRVSQAIILLADNLDKVMPVVATLATLVGGRYALSMSLAAINTGVATVNSIAYQTALIRLQARQTGATFAQIALNTAMAANPIGLLIVATAALAAGLVFLANRYDKAKIAQRELTEATNAATSAGDAYQRALEDAATKSGKARDAALKHAEALRIVYRDAVNAARALAQTRIAETLAADAEAKRANARAQRQANQPRMGAGGFNVVQQGGALNAMAAQQRADQARSDADAAIRAYNEQEQRLKDLQAGVGINPLGNGGGGAATDTKKGKGPSGPTPEELARQRELLSLQADIERLRAQGRENEASAAQMQLDTLQLAKQYEDAGFTDAQARAKAQVDAVARAEAASRGRQAAVERTASILDMAREAERQIADTVSDELSYRVEIARLLGDEAAIRSAEREEFINRRINDLLAQRPGLSRAAAEAQATNEADNLRAAEIVGGLPDTGNLVAQQAAAYAEIDRLRQMDKLSEQEAIAAKAQINEQYWNARLTGEGSMLDGIASLQNSSIKELAALGKAAALAQATIQGFLAIQTAVASAPFPFNVPAIAFATAQTATNLAGIAGVGFKSGGYTGNGGTGEVAGAVHGQEYVFDASATKRIGVANLEALRRGGIPSVPSARSLSGGGSQSFSISMPIDARGADLAAAARVQGAVDDLKRRLPTIIRDATSRQDRYRLGRNVQS